MEVYFKGIEQVDDFVANLHLWLNAKLKDLPTIISQMGIAGEHIVIEFSACQPDTNYFLVHVMDNIFKPKTYQCAMRLYFGFSCDDGNTVKEFSWCDVDKKLRLYREQPVGIMTEITEITSKEDERKVENRIKNEMDVTEAWEVYGLDDIAP